MNHELFGRTPCVIVMLSLVLIGMVMNHIRLFFFFGSFLDHRYPTSQFQHTGRCTSPLPPSVLSISQSIRERSISSYKWLARFYSNDRF